MNTDQHLHLFSAIISLAATNVCNYALDNIKREEINAKMLVELFKNTINDDEMVAVYLQDACRMLKLENEFIQHSKDTIERQKLDQMSAITGLREKLTEIIPITRREQ